MDTSNDRAAKVRRTETARYVTKTHNDLGPPFTDDYYPYTKGQIERAYAQRRYDDGKRAWNTYYQSNTINGYKDRHYILREFVELNDALVAAKAAVEAALGGNDKKEEESAAAPLTPTGGDSDETTNTPAASSNTTIPDDEQHRPLLLQHRVRWMEIGCGVGNAVMPAMRDYPMLAMCGFDISSVAINLFQKKAVDEKMTHRVNICVTNLAEEDVPKDFLKRCLVEAAPPTTAEGASSSTSISNVNDDDGKVDFASIIFVLSAIPAAKFSIFLKRARALMRTGGVLFFRDYYEEDMAQKRFSKENRIDDKTFFRVDGTLSHFFSAAEIAGLFCKANGFELIEEKVVEREVENRKDQNTMHRRWYQARFRCV